MKLMHHTTPRNSLKRFVRNTSEWIQAVLMLIGAFAVFAYSKQRWPEVTNFTTDLASSVFTICAIGFFALYCLVRPFLEGFREAEDTELEHNRSKIAREDKSPRLSNK